MHITATWLRPLDHHFGIEVTEAKTCDCPVRKLFYSPRGYECGPNISVKNLLKTDIKMWDLLGGPMSFSPTVFSEVVRHRTTLMFVFLSLLVFFAADPSNARDYIPFWFSMIVWPLAFCLYLLAYEIELFSVAALTQLLPWLRVPTPLLSLIALTPAVYLCEKLVDQMSNGAFPEDILSRMVFYFLTVQGVETLFYRFIMPGVRQEIESRQQKRHLVVGGEKIELCKLLHIEAREHHVHLTFDDDKSLFRARLGDIVAQTKTEDGVQPHRSWWVARDPAIRTERRDGRLFLRLRDDTEVPVARTRVNDVLDWLETHINPLQ